MDDLLRDMLNGRIPDPYDGNDRQIPHTSRTKEERIEAHLKAVLEAKGMKASAASFKSTMDSVQKQRYSKLPDASALKPISVTELKPARVAYKGRILFCTIITPPLLIMSAMTLVEDGNGDVEGLAVYNLTNPEAELSVGRKVAILEPFCKVRMDGTTGIRVDDPGEILFDVELTSFSRGAGADIQSIIGEETATETKAATTSDKAGIMPIIPDRRPKMHRFVVDKEAIRHRDEGNAAFKFKSRHLKEAEQHYTAALKTGKKSLVATLADGQDGIALWTLYSNRSMARLKLGRPDLALKDAIMSHTGAPIDEAKPLLRCIQALSALGYRSEAHIALESARDSFQDDATMFAEVQRKLHAIRTLRVGPTHRYKTIKAAVFAAPPGAEILVEAGVYTDMVVLRHPVTLRSVAQVPNDLTPIDAPVGDWAEIRVQWAPAVVVDIRGDTMDTVKLIGFRIICEGPLNLSLQAVSVKNESSCVLRDCKISSTSGPAMAASNGARIMAEQCAVYDSAQGGVLSCDDGILALRQVEICYNAANGLELRTGGSATLESCNIFANGRQGMLIWNKAGDLSAKGCDVHSHRGESGITVMENTPSLATFRDCNVYSNDYAGIAIQSRGRARIVDTKVLNNCEGILIQGPSNAVVKNCEVSDNRANGIFVGYDHTGNASIVGNNVHDNQFKGILLGTGRNNPRVEFQDNFEHGNRGLPPSTPSSFAKGQEKALRRRTYESGPRT